MLRPGLEASTGAPAATTRITATSPTSAPGVGRRWRVSPASEVGVGAPLRSSVMVTEGTIEHRALDGALQDAADDLPEYLAAATAKSAARIVVTVHARAIARAFQLAASARHLADFGADTGDLAIGLL